MALQLPVFVYGTLRRDQINYDYFLAGRTVAERPAVLTDHALYAPGLPYVVPFPGSRVVGDLMVVGPEMYEAVLRRLDRLEGYRPEAPDLSHYVRTACPVQTTDTGAETVMAWAYLAGRRAAASLDPADLVADGDWARHAA